MEIKKHIPNLITCGNLFCGCLAAVFAFQGNLVLAAYLVGIAIVLDFFDGFAARMLHVSGEMGKQLDSLADMVTFGVVPGIVMFQLLSICVMKSTLSGFDLVAAIKGEAQRAPALPLWLPFCGFCLTIFSALRLAKFNIDIRQTDSFIGLPTPANAILICSLPLILDLHAPGNFDAIPPLSAIISSLSSVAVHSTYSDYILNPWFLIGLTALLSFLMVAELPLFALKFKNFSWQENKMRYFFLILAMALLIIFQYIGIPIILFLYVLLSVLNNLLNKYRNEVQG
jgi:CDP-diacylglycerol--serine O-phosphatidyltransferase